MCYANLLAGRATGVSTSTSPGQTAQAQQGIAHVNDVLTGIFAPNCVFCCYSCFR